MGAPSIEMVNRIKQNNISKRKQFKGDNRVLMHTEKSKTVTEYTFPMAYETEIELFKAEIQEKSLADKRDSFFILLASFVLVTLIFLGFYKLL